MRAFIAIDLDQKIKTCLSRLISQVNKGERNVKWINPQGMHLTLKFLGEIPEDKLAGIEEALRKAVKNHASFPLRLRETGQFPAKTEKPRVLWVGVEKNEALRALQSNLESLLEKIGFPAENRTFHPHLTLGRVKSQHRLQPTLKEMEKHKEEDFGSMIASQITLFRSTLKPEGAEYTVISEFKLR